MDFSAPKARLVVEVDGASHVCREGQDAALPLRGYRVLRIPATVVLRDLGQALALVQEALAG